MQKYDLGAVDCVRLAITYMQNFFTNERINVIEPYPSRSKNKKQITDHNSRAIHEAVHVLNSNDFFVHVSADLQLPVSGMERSCEAVQTQADAAIDAEHLHLAIPQFSVIRTGFEELALQKEFEPAGELAGHLVRIQSHLQYGTETTSNIRFKLQSLKIKIRSNCSDWHEIQRLDRNKREIEKRR